MRKLLLAVAVLGLVGAGCGGGASVPSTDLNPQAIVASSPGSVGVGPQRVLVAVIDADSGRSLAAPDIDVTATLRDRIGSPMGEYDAAFLWTVPDVRGVYRFDMDIPGAGTFQITIDSDEFGEMGPIGLVTVEDPQMVNVGEPAPLSETRTTDEYDLADITTDPEPDPSFYEMTLAEAVESGPSVIVFATPAWCTSQACGPLLDQVKALSEEFPTLNYVHVEIYENINASSFEELEVVPSVLEWGLPSEPWVFVTDADGVVSAAFEGVASDSELVTAFAQVSA